MNITTLALYNFRNFTQVDEIGLPSNALLIAAAPNATGKTNFLEALVVLLRGKSFRATHKECVQWGQDSFVVRGTIAHETSTTELAVQYHEPSRKLRVEENGVPASPVTFYSHYPLILFLPEDTFIFARGPAARRNFLNRTLISRPHYVAALVQYHRILKQRNVALKGAREYSDIAAWTELLIEHGQVLSRHRQEFVAYITTHLNEIYGQLSGETLEFAVALGSGESEESLAAVLERQFDHERRFGYTMAGPHRDDLSITVDNRPVGAVLSQGQTRSLVMALKIASWRYIYSVTQEKPIILLDEVLSELDLTRQTTLLRHLPAAQIIVTATEVPESVRDQDNVHLLDLGLILPAVENFTSAPQASEVAVAAS